MRIWIAPLVALALLAGCKPTPQQPTNQLAASAPLDPVARMKALPEAEQLTRAAAVVFPDDRSHRINIDDQSYVLTPQRLLWSGDRPILVSGGQGDDCHACAGTLATHYLTVVGDGFAVDKAYPATAAGTSFGAAPTWHARDDIASVPVIQSERGSTNQGYTCVVTDLVELRPDGPATIAEALPTGYSDAGAVTDEKATGVEGRIVAGRKDHDFAVTYVGSVKGSTRYEKQGTVYKIVGKPTAIPDC